MAHPVNRNSGNFLAQTHRYTSAPIPNVWNGAPPPNTPLPPPLVIDDNSSHSAQSPQPQRIARGTVASNSSPNLAQFASELNSPQSRRLKKGGTSSLSFKGVFGKEGADRVISKLNQAGQPIFGVALDTTVERDLVEMGDEQVIPFLVEECVQYLDRDDILKSEGLFRQSGKTSDIQEIKGTYDKGKYVTLMGYTDPNAVTGVLKSYIRELPDPLIPFTSYPQFLQFMKTTSVSGPSTLVPLQNLIRELPKFNKIFLRLLFLLLKKASTFESFSRMGPQNLAIVIGPNILRAKEETMMSVMEDSSFVNSLTTVMIEHVDFLFSGDPVMDPYTLHWIKEKRFRNPPVYPTFTEVQAKEEEKKKVRSFLAAWFPKRARKDELVNKKILLQ